MAPEQVRGKTVDKRADIWALGIVLYELLTGRRLFQGADVTEILAAVVKDIPDLGRTPPEIRRLLAACLERNPENRLRDIADWRLLLDAPSSAAKPRSAKWLWIAAAFLAIGGAGALLQFFSLSPPRGINLLYRAASSHAPCRPERRVIASADFAGWLRRSV